MTEKIDLNKLKRKSITKLISASPAASILCIYILKYGELFADCIYTCKIFNHHVQFFLNSN